MRKFLFLLFVFISAILFIEAPPKYSRGFCQTELLLFLTMAFIFLYKKVKLYGIVNFDTFFLLSFFLINYVHPSFVYPNDKLIPSFAFPYNEDIISYALAVAQLGISFYMLGSVLGEKSKKKSRDYYIGKREVQLSQRVAFISSLGVMTFVFLIMNRQSGIVHLYSRLMILIVSTICLAVYNTAISLNGSYNFMSIIKKNRLNLCSTLFFMSSILYLGSRDLVIFLGMFILMAINIFYIRLRLKWILPLIIFGGGLMIILTITRVTDVNLMSASFIEVLQYGITAIIESPDALSLMFVDFFINARNLYDGIDYALRDGLLYGATYIQYLFVFIPFGGVYFTKLLTGKTLEEVHTAKIITEENSAGFGLGTNMISDIYMNFSLFGVAILMLLFGLFVAKLSCSRSRYGTFALLSLFANSLYIPRANIFCWLDLFAFIVIFDFLLHTIESSGKIKAKPFLKA